MSNQDTFNPEKKEAVKVVYTALFVNNPEELQSKFTPVHPNTFYHHSTIAFKPDDGISSIEVGKIGGLKITGRVTTDKVDAIIVANSKSTNDNPHITLSTAEGVKPFESNNEIIKAQELGEVIPIDDIIEVTEGYFNGKEDVTK